MLIGVLRVLNAFRRHCVRHARDSAGDTDRKARAQRLSASLRSTLGYDASEDFRQAVSSTPFGVTAFDTAIIASSLPPTAGAQHLSASLRSTQRNHWPDSP